MKFQLISFIAALALIAPVLAAPEPHNNPAPQKCDPHKWECPYGYSCCNYYCVKGDKCPKKDHHKDHKDKDHKY